MAKEDTIFFILICRKIRLFQVSCPAHVSKNLVSRFSFPLQHGLTLSIVLAMVLSYPSDNCIIALASLKLYRLALRLDEGGCTKNMFTMGSYTCIGYYRYWFYKHASLETANAVLACKWEVSGVCYVISQSNATYGHRVNPLIKCGVVLLFRINLTFEICWCLVHTHLLEWSIDRYWNGPGENFSGLLIVFF